ncbi:MAG TPA: CHRD domain-containing protein [Actinomycetota bacterium]|nr:CHRD domain-containing protein [Actinomycetota bacterium]
MRSRAIRLAIVALTGAAILTTAMLAEGSPAATQAGRPAVRLARLTGEVEVPTGDLDGSGLSTVIVHPARGRLCFTIVVDDIVLPATAAHIHVGRAGVAGPIVVPLTAPDAEGTSAGCVSGVDQGLLTAIKRHPRQYYVNVHTTDFPAGAVRGQLHRP